jgi:hypothetical protein
MLGKSSMVLTELQRHLNRNHDYCKGKSITFLHTNANELKYSLSNLASATKDENVYLSDVSYKLSYDIAHCGETHLITNILIMICAEAIVSSVLDDIYLKTIQNPLSNYTVSR